MDFDFSEEQLQLRDAVARYLGEEYDFDRYKAVRRSSAGWDREVWRGLAQLGVLGMFVPAEQGGLGFGPVEMLITATECGRHLVLEPVLSSAVIATAALRPFAAEPAVSALMAAMAAGEKIATLAHFESDARFEGRWVTTHARRTAGGYRLDGHKGVVMHAPIADTLLVSARTSG